MTKEEKENTKKVSTTTKRKTVKKVDNIKKEKKVENSENVEIKHVSAQKQVLTFTVVELISIVIIVSLIVAIISGFLVFKNHRYFSNIAEPRENIKENYKLNEFIEVFNSLKNKYVNNVTDEELLNAATKGMFDYLDVYTNYLDESTTLDLQDRLNGEYKGIGVEISNNESGYVEIVNVFPNTPAERAGLKPGDLIISVNGKSMVGKTSSDVASTIKGNANLKNVTIVYKRGNEEKEIKIDISEVIIPSVEKNIFDDKIGYLKINTFSNTTYSQVKSSLEELEKEGIKSLIIDLRDNTGGYLLAAKSISELFVKNGDPIYQLKYRNDLTEIITSNGNSKRNYKIVVLVNESSASASEILTLALKESYGATVVGKKTFGKGTVQDTEILSNGSMIKYTSAYWLSPNGNSINNIGIKPDIEVSMGDKEDTQLEAAKRAIK